MSLFDVIAVLLVLAALFSYANCRYIRLPTTIGVMFIALVTSLALIALGRLGIAGSFRDHARHLMAGIDFDAVLLHGMLAFLLFAGSLHLDLSDLAKEWLPITAMSLLGTAISTAVVGAALYAALPLLHLHVPLLHCLLFGALISPTDPIAVLGIMKQAGTPKSLETQTAGESLFNDGVGVVLFLAILELAAAAGPDAPSLNLAHLAKLLLQEALGGAAFGLVAGALTYQLLKRVDNYQVEVLLTLALAMGAYAGAEHAHVSAPIAVVVAGLLIGNQGRHFAMSHKTEEHLDTFWELVDEILNALLFMLLGLEILVMPFPARFLLAGAAGIAVTLLARWLSVASLVASLRPLHRFDRGAVTILTWGGLRGGISVAMALSLPDSPHRNLLLAITYCVVVFSVFAQGLTMGPLVTRLLRTTTPRPATPSPVPTHA